MNYAELKVGDRVGVEYGIYGYPGYKTDSVTKVTKTQITLSSGDRFTVNTGKQVGYADSWRATRLISVEQAERGIEETRPRVVCDMVTQMLRGRDTKLTRAEFDGIVEQLRSITHEN